MALFKCKMCGGSLEVNNNETVITCEYCGTQQTLPTAQDENLQSLFNRANVLRMKSEFDKAEQIYEKIIQADDAQAEAYWGLILCKYGIEYVEDPVTYKRVPTCHRTSFDSIIADDDYKAALEHADATQRAVYEAEAKKIDRIQKEILALSQKEEPYDVFICYKESDENGKRTQDSAIANDIYYQLTQEGFKVFYAAITLEDKLGSAYEPCIFAALNSAKVMLAIGTKPEYFNAVWVKNEWSRFLKIMKKDRSKVLIPCYLNMDAYELPEEFAHLQAQDMSKIGFINDVVRGIKKVLNVNEPAPTAAKEIVSSGKVNVDSLVKRMFISLEDGENQTAADCCDKILDIDPENAEAYLGKLMLELKVKQKEDLKNLSIPFDDKNNYQRAIRYANESLKAELEGYIYFINDRNENAHLDKIYLKAQKLMEQAATVVDLKEASEIFESIGTYKDAVDMAKVCSEKASEFGDLEEKCKELLANLKSIEKGELESKVAAIKKKAQEIEANYNTLQSLKEEFPIIEQKISEITDKINVLQMEEKRLETERESLGFFAKKQKQEKANEILKVQDEIGTFKKQIQEAEKCKKGYASAESISKVIAQLVNERANVVAEIEKYSNVGSKDELISELNQSETGRAMLIFYSKMKEMAANAKVGGTIAIGKYPQTYKGEEEPIEWLVLTKQNSKLLLISKYGLAEKEYHEKCANITWENCTLRKWLNKELINEAFTSTEQMMIQEVTVKADINPKYSTDPGKDTRDKLFLLSIAEAKRYFKDNDSRMCEPTRYAVNQGTIVNEDNCCYWWLRSPGIHQNYAAGVEFDGAIDESGDVYDVYENGGNVYAGYAAVRPALWIDLNS